MNFRFELLKRIINSKNPYISLDDVMMLSMSFLAEGKIEQVQYDEIQILINTQGV